MIADRPRGSSDKPYATRQNLARLSERVTLKVERTETSNSGPRFICSQCRATDQLLAFTRQVNTPYSWRR